MFIRRTIDPNKASNKEKLSQKEVNWLVETWQPEPMVPVLSDIQQLLADSMVVSLLFFSKLYENLSSTNSLLLC
jgi:hypothetical protein